jgi:putative transcriptional regulator
MKSDVDYENMSVFEQVKTGLEQVLAHGRGELPLKTTMLPAPPPPASRSKVIALRRKLGMSQSVFAAALNVPTEVVEGWESGTRKPARSELRLIELLRTGSQTVVKLIMAGGRAEGVAKNGKPRKRSIRAA